MSSSTATTAAAAAAATTPEQDKFKKFEGDGVIIKAKLVGTELVMEPRGDKMCQNSISRLKAIIKGQKIHKRRIVMKINYSGVKIIDEKTEEILHQHEVPQISFIASDDTDSRTFGYVCDVPNKAHQFICFKTGGPAIQVMSVINQLFEAVLEKKKSAASASKQSSPAAAITTHSGSFFDDEPATAAAATELAATDKQTNKRTSTATKKNKSDSPLNANNSSSSFFDEPFLDHPPVGANKKISSMSRTTSAISGADDDSALQFHYQPEAAPVSDGNGKKEEDQTILNSFFDDKDPFGDSAIGLKTSKSIDLVCDQFGDLVLGGGGGANNYSSISLNDSSQLGLTRQSSFTAASTTLTNNSASFTAPTQLIASGHNNNNNSHHPSAVPFRNHHSHGHQNHHLHQLHHQLSSSMGTDKYAVFYEIDNLPSIFESTSSLNGSRTKLPNFNNYNNPSAAPTATAAPTPIATATQLTNNIGSAGGLNFKQQQQPTMRATAGAGAALSAAIPPPLQPTTTTAAPVLSRQLTNPFDDDFFA